MSERCMCGDPACPSCGTAQGYCPTCERNGWNGCWECDPEVAADEADRWYDEQRDLQLLGEPSALDAVSRDTKDD